jgi:hypothetical protein
VYPSKLNKGVYSWRLGKQLTVFLAILNNSTLTGHKMKPLSDKDQEAQKQSEEIQKEVGRIFELARTNDWSFEQFAKKILAGASEYDLGYFAIAAQLVQHVTGVEGKFAIQILKCLLASVKELDTVKIQQAQQLFYHGLIINKIKAAQAYQQQQKQKQRTGNHRNRKRTQRHENLQN